MLFPADESNLVISGVNVKRFIAQPSWVLRHPKNFLVGLMDSLCSIYRLPEVLECEKLESITSALCLLLEAQPLLCEHLPDIGHIPSILASLQNSDSGSPIIDSCLKVILAFVRSNVCIFVKF
uniref:DnaJ homolog subfamily C member 13 (Trinotate prediction) n=1 Tax=Myxobolus squamalis TaxID=59785 RepID=A0A6B2GB07_MYXSQ